ncbi:MAG TPA: S9 family peptidase [Gemmatimonadaceae bacterium]|nr:S9 family peptidase [Gemmatimonadaceae bacterium]
MKRASVLLAACIFAGESAAQARVQRPMTFDDFLAVKNVGDPQISPDGASVLYTVRTADINANRRTTITKLAPLSGGAARQFPDVATPATDARWSPDGRRVAYIAGSQLWIADSTGAGARQLTRISAGVSGPVWAPSGDKIAFVTGVYPECDAEECNAARAKAADTVKVKARIADNLLFRHWMSWTEPTRAHLFVISPDGTGLRDVTPGVRYDVPPGPFGGSEAYAFSPDGREIAYTAKDQGRENAWSTDINVYTVPVAGGTPTVITLANRGADQNPVYSPDGRNILYASQARAGFESDRWRLMSYDRARRTSRELLPRWDRSADNYAFAPAGDAVYVGTVDASRIKTYRIGRTADGWTDPRLLSSRGNNTALSVSRDGRSIAWLRDAFERPAEVHVATVGATGLSGERRLTHENDALIADLKLYPGEDFWFRGADGDSVQGLLLKPPQYEAGKKFPVLFLIHGGPQGEWLDSWHGRWNFQMFASRGFGVVAINPRGSIGYGQKFTDQISRDWGGKVYVDLMNGLDAALARNPWLDGTSIGAAGGSYGGYMTNWIAGHSNRFKALFTHAGVYNLEAMYGATEEIWFTDWETGGPYWDKNVMDTQFRRWSPHLFAGNFRTPMLVIHGELDYRVPYTEGLSLFTALQRQNVPSRLIIFPDEGHWIAKPQNQRLWWSEVLGWFGKYLR